MVTAKVNGNLVSPMHVLANAEVVEIITYDALSSKSAFQRHQQWLHHAKTRSARHKIMKFLREQAVLSATEITADTVNNFVADLKDANKYERTHSSSSKERKSIWNKILTSFEQLSSSSRSHEDLMHVQNTVGIPKINGKHKKIVQKMNLKINGNSTIRGDNLAQFLHTNIPMYEEVSPGLESWQAGKVSSWHSLEGHPVQWFCVVCIDRRGIMAEVSLALTAVGIMICSCVAEIDRRRGMGVMLFHIEGSDENLVSACENVDVVLGVLDWSAGCSWSAPSNDLNFLDVKFQS
ncbi:putative GTP diphosphokinase RSH1, chloroplastic [Iris pallida]|uniref:GTP diphosphokinase RSH1, chloroplastic n=2 Tax=Iris pallida TaxID=29817 RepID=A0AAX6E1R4_IRIPA|nr:putative GTP diphosphokinase RSH1, chloroplastic [Iris pallida]